MSDKLSYHGDPNSQVFGILGKEIGTDEGSTYNKKTDDSMNIGWKKTFGPTPTPTTTPTPTPTPEPVDYLRCSNIQITGSTKYYGNEVALDYRLEAPATISIDMKWGNAAIPTDPVIIFGNTVSATLNSNETSQSFIVRKETGDYSFRFMRSSSSLDTVNIGINSIKGGLFTKARLISYASSSYTPKLRIGGNSGRYFSHTKNLAADGMGIIVGPISLTSPQITSSNASFPSAQLLEFVSYNDILTFDPQGVADYLISIPYFVNGTVWTNYDENGKAKGRWIDRSTGVQRYFDGSGEPHAFAFTANQVDGFTTIEYGTNLRKGATDINDPRLISYQLNAICNYQGNYSFSYLDSYGIIRSVSGTGYPPNTTVYAVACGSSISTISVGSAVRSNILC